MRSHCRLIDDHKKTTLDDHKKTTLDDHKKTTLDDHKKTTLDDHKKMTLDDHMKTTLDDHKKTTLDDHKKTTLDDLRFVFLPFRQRSAGREPESLVTAVHDQVVCVRQVRHVGESNPQLQLHELVGPLTLLHYLGDLNDKQHVLRGFLGKHSLKIFY